MKNLFYILPISLLFTSPLTSLQSSSPETRYEKRELHDPDGIGIFYMGREIAKVMGHQAFEWLERPTREKEERTDLLLKEMQLKPGEIVADIGAGSGFFSWRMAKAVAPEGKVYAVEIQQEMLDLIALAMKKHDTPNIVPTLGTTSDPKLPENTIDTILLVDVYHEFDKPFEMMASMIRSLKKGGRIVWVEFRAEDPAINIKTVHKMSVEQARKEAAVFPELTFEKVIKTLPQQHIMIFRKS